MVHTSSKIIWLFATCLIFHSCDINVLLGKTFHPQDYPGDYRNSEDSSHDIIYLRMQSHFYVGYLEVGGEKYYINWVHSPSTQVDFQLYTDECSNKEKPTFWFCLLSKEKSYFKLKVSKDYYFNGLYDGKTYNLYKVKDNEKADFSFRRNCFCEVNWEHSSACTSPKTSDKYTSE